MERGISKLRILLVLLAVFFTGWLANNVYSFIINYDKENPYSPASKERPSPADRIDEDQILVEGDKVVINIANATWAKFADTNSMDPVIDSESHAIKLVPKSADELEVGDIISYKSEIGVIIHRIIEKGEDSDGVFFIAKGDNNKEADSDKIRFSQITGVVVGVVY